MIIPVLLTFIAVFLATMALYLVGNTVSESPAAQVKRRLRSLADDGRELLPAGVTGDLIRADSTAEQFLFRLPLLERVKTLVESSGVAVSPTYVIALSMLAAVVAFCIVFILSRNWPLSFLAATVPIVLPLLFFKHRQKELERKFTEQLPDALTMIARSLRAGHSLGSAIELIGQELPEPAGGFFSVACEKQKLGMRMLEALSDMLNSVDSMDLRFFLTIIKINIETGGNLAEILEKLAETIRGRQQLRRQVQVYTAEGRMSGVILAILPVALFGIFYVIRPGYLDVFFTERMCQYALAAAVLANLVGFVMIRKIVNIRI